MNCPKIKKSNTCKDAKFLNRQKNRNFYRIGNDRIKHYLSRFKKRKYHSKAQL